MKVNSDTLDLQRVMNTRLWRCVEEMGGVQAMVERTGISKQTFYNMEKNRSFPSAATIGVMARCVPGLDVGKVYTENESTEWRFTNQPVVNDAPSNSMDLEKALMKIEMLGSKLESLERENARMIKENERLGKENDRISSENEQFVQAFLAPMLVDVEGKKLTASSGSATVEGLTDVGMQSKLTSALTFLAHASNTNPYAALLANYHPKGW